MDAFTQCMKEFKKNWVLENWVLPKNIDYKNVFENLWEFELSGIVKCKKQFHQVDYSTLSKKDKDKYFSETEYPKFGSVSDDLLNDKYKWNHMKDVLGSNNKIPLWGKGYSFFGFFPKYEFQINSSEYEWGNNIVFNKNCTDLKNNYTGKSYTIENTIKIYNDIKLK